MSTLPQFSYSAAEIRRVRRVQFGVLSPDELKRMSVVEVTKPGTYNQGVPIRGGLNDPTLGANDARTTCATCKNTYTGSGKINECPGHFGHIELASPMWHVGFLNEVYKLIQCVCISCSRIRADKMHPDFLRASQIKNGKKRLMAMLRLCRTKMTCRGSSAPPGADASAGGTVDEDGNIVAPGADYGCGAVQPKYKRSGLRIDMEFDEKHDADLGLADRKQTLTPERAYAVFRNLSDADVMLLGLDFRYARPEWLVLTVVPVPPPHVRPSVEQGTGVRADDDITHKLSEIVKANIAVANAKKSGQPAITVEQYEANLQYHCATLIDNQLPGLPAATQRGGKTLKAFRERLVGKGGRVRGNLMGKRVDFSARTVITADPILSIHQVGVPRSIASNLTVPERVNRYNMARLQRLVDNGPFSHPGAKFIIRENGLRVDLRYASNASELALKEGWIVERHLMDDDTVLFNRQPTLHKMSIMCHRAKVLDYSTFRMNLTCTTPYNADFDGDEMNLHVLQTLPAIAEAQELMAVPRLIITAQGNRPVMGIVQDTLLGSRLFTKRDVFLECDMVMNLLLWITPWSGKVPLPAVLKPDRKRPGRPRCLWTGKQMFSSFIPEVNYSKNSQGAPDAPWTLQQLWADDTRVLIERGQLHMGILDKASLGNKGGSLLHVIMNDVSPEDTRDFINTCQRVVNYWLLNRGFSIGIGDSEAPNVTMRKVSTIIKEAKDSVHGMVQKGQAGELKRQPGQSMMQSFEALVNACLNKARDQASKAVTEVLDESNAVVAMVSAGSKGSNINISQIIACVGQQNVEGKRIPYGFRDRTLPHFCKFDLGPAARGFVENSYLKGLTPTEFFFHMMGGREGLIDTAVKTAETGYTQRRLVKAMEDISVRYDCTVRNSSNEVVQFLYGEDGMDGRWIEDVEFPTWRLSGPRLRAAFAWDPDAGADFGRSTTGREFFLDPEVAEDMRANMDTRDALAREFEALEAGRATIYPSFLTGRRVDKGEAPMPVAVGRLILNCAQKYGIRHDGISDLHPVTDVIEPVNALIKRLVIVPGRDHLSVEAQANATALLEAMLRGHLASKPIISRWRLTKAAFRDLLGTIETRFFISHAAAGEMCGVLAAQSIGEPTTQMTLNTFHYAGVSAKNVTLGVPRLKELINVAKHIRTPSVTIFVKDHLRGSDEAYSILQRSLEYTTMGDIVEETQVLYDPDPTTSVLPEDADWVAIHAAVPEADVSFASLSPWVLRMRMSKEAMVRKAIRFREIKDKIREVDPSLYVIENDDNADVPLLRIRISNAGALPAGADEVAEESALAAAALEGSGDEDQRTLKDLQQLLLFDLPLRGIPHIRKLYMSDHKGSRWSPERGLEPIKDVKRFETEGTNLQPILCHPDVDMVSTVSNDVVEILEVLGIEACRQALFNEIKNVISFDGSYVNYRHLAILVDTMTFRGYLTAVTRHGINRVESGPLMRSSFEETVEILMDAAMYAEADPMRGVSDNILLGQLCPIGTGHFDLLADEARLRDAIPVGAAALEQMAFGGVGAGGGYGGGGLGQTPLMASPDAFSPIAGSVYDGLGGAAFSPIASTPLDASSTPALSPGFGGVSPGDAYRYIYSPAPGLGPGSYAPTSPGYGGGVYGKSPAFTPSADYDPVGSALSGASPATGFSPTSPAYSPTSVASGASPYGSGTSPAYSPTSPAFSDASPGPYGPTSPAYSPTSPAFSDASPATGTGASPYGASPAYSPTSPAFSDASPGPYGPTSPAYSPTSPAYSPTSVGGGGGGGASSPAYSPTSPAYSPTSVGGGGGGGASGAAYSPTSPAFASPSSPSYGGYSPTSPALSTAGYSAGGSGGYSPPVMSASGPSPHGSGGYSPPGVSAGGPSPHGSGGYSPPVLSAGGPSPLGSGSSSGGYSPPGVSAGGPRSHGSGSSSGGYSPPVLSAGGSSPLGSGSSSGGYSPPEAGGAAASFSPSSMAAGEAAGVDGRYSPVQPPPPPPPPQEE